MTTFNLLIATIGRPTLERQLQSLLPQLQEVDCLTVVFDGTSVQNLPILKEFKCTVELYSEPKALGFWGHAVRNKYAKIMKQRDFVLHGDDDDIYLPNVIDNLRILCTNNKTLYIAKMDDPCYGVLPKTNEIIPGNIGTPCGIVPWKDNMRSRWGLYNGADANFYKSIANFNKDIVFLDLLIYKVRP